MDVGVAFRPMPASFGDEDVAQVHRNSFESIQFPQDESQILAPPATASRSTENGLDIDLGDVDWHKYDPPTALCKAPNVSSIILLDILSQSIVNVKTRVADEDRAKENEDERRRVAEEEATKKGKSPEPYLPIIIPAERHLEPDISSMNDMYSVAGISSTSVIAASTSGNVAPVSAMRDRARRRNVFRRLFQRRPAFGESSSAGGAREALRQKLDARLSRLDLAMTDPKAQEALKALRKAGFIAHAEPAEPDLEVECVSCLDDISVKDAVKVPCHSYCKDCFVRLVIAAVEHEAQWPPKCCLNQIPFRLVAKNIPDDLKRTFQERWSEWEVPVSERVYCSQPACGIWIHPKHVKLDKRQARCESGHVTCTICRRASHGDDDCPQDYEMTLTKRLAEEEGWKRCFNCHAMVEHREACQHMTCRCGSEFCYVCCLPWKTCQCTMDQLNELKEGAVTRREQRRVKDEIEAEELRAILAQIEEFERDEAARAEREHLEQTRLEAERLQRQIKERIRFENLRRKDIIAKFRHLRIHLNRLHQLQHAMMDARQEERAADLLQEAESTKIKLAERHEAERHQFQHGLSARVSSKEVQLAKEYSARVSTERKVEEEYLEQLREFWNGRPQADEEIERGMLPLRRRMDQGHKAWQKWKEGQMLLYRARLEDEQSVREEVMYSQRERTKDLCVRKELELMRRMVAEKTWFREIVLEREKLLGERELQEVDGDADSLFTGEEEEEEEKLDAVAHDGHGSLGMAMNK
ncbi:hypothetical protein E4U41_007485 [Claviceps citrina]|nr:hypothetical protein E4U41_007485 [Claviceps citrina]